MAQAIMVQGTASSAGKSLLATALCRVFAQDGYTVAPFKSQNMALNSFITDDGLEMGRAQAVQAQAAGIAPSVWMNPILLKPSSDTGSQVIVNGEVRGNMSAAAYFQMKRTLIPEIQKAYDKLAGQYDIIVIEGAGSPAEINLRRMISSIWGWPGLSARLCCWSGISTAEVYLHRSPEPCSFWRRRNARLSRAL